MGLRTRSPWQGLAAPTERLHTRGLRDNRQARSGTHGRPAPAHAHSLYRDLHRPPADSPASGKAGVSSMYEYEHPRQLA